MWYAFSNLKWLVVAVRSQPLTTLSMKHAKLYSWQKLSWMKRESATLKLKQLDDLSDFRYNLENETKAT